MGSNCPRSSWPCSRRRCVGWCRGRCGGRRLARRCPWFWRLFHVACRLAFSFQISSLTWCCFLAWRGSSGRCRWRVVAALGSDSFVSLRIVLILLRLGALGLPVSSGLFLGGFFCGVSLRFHSCFSLEVAPDLSVFSMWFFAVRPLRAVLVSVGGVCSLFACVGPLSPAWLILASKFVWGSSLVLLMRWSCSWPWPACWAGQRWCCQCVLGFSVFCHLWWS